MGTVPSGAVPIPLFHPRKYPVFKGVFSEVGLPSYFRKSRLVGLKMGLILEVWGLF